MPARFRFWEHDVGVKHITMNLEASIGQEQMDFFQFPGINKTGCALNMELAFDSGRVGQGIPKIRSMGAVASRLHTESVSPGHRF